MGEKTREPISVLVPTFNEEANIGDCLAGLTWADELVVVDSFSTDRTVEISRQHATRVLEHEYVDSATQKNWALPQLIHEWVLIVDADERVTPELRDEIVAVLADPNRLDGYLIYRLNHFMGRKVRYCGWQNDCCLRLFRKSLGRYQDREVHADIELNGRAGHLRNKLLHYTFTSFDQYMKKFDTYTIRAAGDREEKTPRVRWHHLTLRPAFRFFKRYVLNLGFLDGLTGLMICGLGAFSVFMKYARLWERQQRKGH
jgi:glycosyltransferase involved in cell wall biosynthesis